MAIALGRDPETARKALRAWLQDRLGTDDLTLTPLTTPSSTGFSSETFLFDAAWHDATGTGTASFVARAAPEGQGVFPSYDIAAQYRVIAALQGRVPLPPLHWLEEDPSILGTPFFVMDRVEGRIPNDDPTHHMEGWLHDEPPAARAAMLDSGLEALAAIHRQDPVALGLEFLAGDGPEPIGLARQLAFYRHFLAEIEQDRPNTVARAALEWLAAHRPAGERIRLCWGDARIGNMIFHEQRCVAVLDWEMATLGDPEQDLGWWTFMERHHSTGCGVPMLEGFPDRDATIARWEQLTGLEARDVEYYEIFAGFRFAVIMQRVIQLVASTGLLPPGSDLEVVNPCTQQLAEMLGVPPPTP